MNNSSIIASSSIPAPRVRSFAALMELYEANFILLRRLMPLLARMEGLFCAQGRGGLPLYVEILEQDRFTTVLRMFYRFSGEQGSLYEAPDIHVRIYHDARVAEAVAGRLRGKECVPKSRSGERCLDVRWRLNRFLYKWLRHFLHRQYDFEKKIEPLLLILD
ncbi:MAG: DUF1249 domain-containing protein [Pseudomonadota bacterium]